MSAKFINFTGNFVIDFILNIAFVLLICLVVVAPIYLWLGSFHAIFKLFDIYMDTSIAKTYLNGSIMFLGVLLFGIGTYFLWKEKSYLFSILLGIVTCVLMYFPFKGIIKLLHNVSQLKKPDTTVYSTEIKSSSYKSGSKTYTRYELEYWESREKIKQIGRFEKIKTGHYNLIAINEKSNVVFQNKNYISEATFEYCKGGVSMKEQKRLEYLDKYENQYYAPSSFELSDLTDIAECSVLDNWPYNFYMPIDNDILIWFDKSRSFNGQKYDMARIKYSKKNTYKYQIVDLHRISDGQWINFNDRDMVD